MEHEIKVSVVTPKTVAALHEKRYAQQIVTAVNEINGFIEEYYEPGKVLTITDPRRLSHDEYNKRVHKCETAFALDAGQRKVLLATFGIHWKIQYHSGFDRGFFQIIAPEDTAVDGDGDGNDNDQSTKHGVAVSDAVASTDGVA